MVLVRVSEEVVEPEEVIVPEGVPVPVCVTEERVESVCV